MSVSREITRLVSFCEVLVGAMPLTDEHGRGMHAELLRVIRGALSLKGARVLASDLMEWMQDVSGQDLLDLDRSLAREGLPTLSLMRSREDARLAKILQRGHIASEEEHMRVSSRLADTALNEAAR